MTALIYHTAWDEYEAATPEGVVSALHEHSKSGTGQSYDEWWRYQQRLWGNIPEPRETAACQAMIDKLVEVGALIEGPKPAISHIRNTAVTKSSGRAHG